MAGSMRAIAFPLRTMVIRSPRCSTASRRSAKLRAASVALISVTKSDYQIFGPGAMQPACFRNDAGTQAWILIGLSPTAGSRRTRRREGTVGANSRKHLGPKARPALRIQLPSNQQNEIRWQRTRCQTVDLSRLRLVIGYSDWDVDRGNSRKAAPDVFIITPV